MKITMLRDFSLNGRLLKKGTTLEEHKRFKTMDLSRGQIISLINKKVAEEVKEPKSTTKKVQKK